MSISTSRIEWCLQGAAMEQDRIASGGTRQAAPAESGVRFTKALKNIVIGKSRSPKDHAIFHKLSLVAFFAWVGLGADGLSSSCYGPQEAFLTLGRHPYLGLFVGLGSMLTIFVISASYSQIVDLFPTGGGGYFVASKLLSPTVGMISGCALLIDYVLTITVSIASGADALCSTSSNLP
jgi:amino acid transporter